jgi:hypothetical protein
MRTAFVKYRSGGGYQAVEDYDYVLDTRKLVESGYYRDTGYSPMVVIEDQQALDSDDDLTSLDIGFGSLAQYNSGTIASLSVDASTTVPGIIAVTPDEMMHTAPRQLSYYETTLSFFGNSDVFADFAGTDSGGNLRITVADVSLFAGRPVTLNSNALPDNIYPNEIYYPVPLSSTTMLLQTTLGGSIVPFSSTGSGVITVVDTLAQFQWSNILGWSNTAPTR